MRQRNNLRDYLKEIGQFGNLTFEQEIDLATRAQSGDLKARDELVYHNLRIVVYFAKQYRNNRLSLDDLIAEGNIGLLEAVGRFDPSYACRFTTFASHWIKSAITHSLQENGRGIRLPAHMYQLMAKYKKVVVELSGAGEKITDEKIAEKLGITVDKVQLLRENKHDTLSLEQKLGFDEDSDTLQDIVPDKAKGPEERTMDYFKHKAIIDAMHKALKPRDMQIMKMRFGIIEEGDPIEWEGKAQTLEAVGQAVGLTRERVRQIEKESCAKMAPYLENYRNDR